MIVLFVNILALHTPHSFAACHTDEPVLAQGSPVKGLVASVSTTSPCGSMYLRSLACAITPTFSMPWACSIPNQA